MSIAKSGIEYADINAASVLEHLHSQQRVSPDHADAVIVKAGTSPWVNGPVSAIILITPANMQSDLLYVDIESISNNGSYQLDLYSGTTLISSCTFSKKNNTADDYARCSVISPVLDASSAITARLASSAGSSETCKVKVSYHSHV